MIKARRIALIMGTSLFGLCIATPALAQSNAADAASGTVQEDAGTGDPNEIVVTGTKRAGGQSVQDAAVAITAISAGELENSSTTNIADLARAVPNVTMSGATTTPGTAVFFIRGMGTSSTIPSTTPGVGVFVDGIYLGVTAGTVLDAFDLEGVEVLRGPQGLLFGRNVTGGAVLLRTTSPSRDFRASANFTIDGALNGTGLNYTGSALVSGPLDSDGKFRAKLAYYRNSDQGYFRNRFDGRNFGQSDTTLVRFAVAADLSESVSNTTRYEYGQVDSDGPTNQSRALGYGDHDFDLNLDFTGYTNYKWAQASNETVIELAGGELVNNVGYRFIHQSSASDVDGLPRFLFNSYTTLDQDQFSEELRYSKQFGPVNATVGAFYYSDDLTYIEQRALPTTRVIGGGRVRSTQYALYSAFDIALGAGFSLNLGGRYSWQDKTGNVQRQLATSPCSIGQRACSSYLFNRSDEWKSFTPKVGLDWAPDRTTHLYAFWTRGFRDGGYNVRQTSAAAPGPYDQEKVDAYEIGLKKRMFDGALTVNLAAFQNDYKGLQRDVSRPDPVLGNVQVTTNAADVRLRGVEAEARLQLGGGFALSGNVGHLADKYRRIYYDLSGNGTVGPEDYALRLPYTPRWTYGAALDYEGGPITARLAYSHRDRTIIQDANTGYLNTRDNIDARVSYRVSKEATVALFGRNLTNNKVNAIDTPLTLSGTRTTLSPIEKGRVVGISLSIGD